MHSLGMMAWLGHAMASSFGDWKWQQFRPRTHAQSPNMSSFALFCLLGSSRRYSVADDAARLQQQQHDDDGRFIPTQDIHHTSYTRTGSQARCSAGSPSSRRGPRRRRPSGGGSGGRRARPRTGTAPPPPEQGAERRGWRRGRRPWPRRARRWRRGCWCVGVLGAMHVSWMCFRF